VEVLRNGILVQERWSEIGIGDIIKVKNNNIFPADLVLLSSRYLNKFNSLFIFITGSFLASFMEFVT